MKRQLRVMSTVGLAVALLAGQANAGTPTPPSGATWAANQKVEYRWKGDAEPPKWLKPAINAAAADSNNSRGSRAAVFSYKAGADSWIGYTADIPTNYAVGYAVRRVPEKFNIRLRPHGYKLDWGTLRWCQYFDEGKWPNGCYDAEMITLHEFGHVQTLGHVDESLGDPWLDSIMHAGPRTKAKIGWNQHEYGRCDVATLQLRYRALNSSTPISTCLSLDTNVSLSASATSISSGSNVTFTAALNIAGKSSYQKLSGDALSGRTVNLQRRLPTESSWTTHATMNDVGGGSYRLTVQPTTTYEWRARFSKPSSEGLNASSSSVVKVTVSKCTGDTCCSGSICRMSTDASTESNVYAEGDPNEGSEPYDGGELYAESDSSDSDWYDESEETWPAD